LVEDTTIEENTINRDIMVPEFKQMQGEIRILIIDFSSSDGQSILDQATTPAFMELRLWEVEVVDAKRD
jgi:ethanolamine utilization protein EutQ (cupin superfamily)